MPAELQKIFYELNQAHFGAELPLPAMSWNSRLSSTAGRFCPGSRNFLRPRPAEIEVATYLRDLPDGAMHVRDTVLHEMIHYFLWHKQRPHGHTAEFHRIMKRVGAKRYNTVPKERAWLHWYECPHCRQGFPTRRRLGVSACAKCCQRYSRGEFDGRFRLVRKPPKTGSATIPESITGRGTPAGEASARFAAAAASPVTDPVSSSAPALSPAEIIRRLEDLKFLVRPR